MFVYIRQPNTIPVTPPARARARNIPLRTSPNPNFSTDTTRICASLEKVETPRWETLLRRHHTKVVAYPLLTPKPRSCAALFDPNRRQSPPSRSRRDRGDVNHPFIRVHLVNGATRHGPTGDLTHRIDNGMHKHSTANL